MKISVASEGSRVSGHFGHCEGFKIYDVNNNIIENESFIENPGHKPGFLPKFLHEQGAEMIIAGGMGAKAQELFSENGIEVIVGAQGDCKNAVESYLSGSLQSTGSVCTAHEHEGNCGE